MTTINIGDVHAEMTRNEVLTRRCLALLANSVIGAPSPTDDLGVWWQRAFERDASLSRGEQIIFWTALAIWNRDDGARIGDLVELDRNNRAAVAAVLAEWLTGE